MLAEQVCACVHACVSECACVCVPVRACVSVSGTNRSLSLLALLSRQLAEQLKDLTKYQNNTGNRTHTVFELHFLRIQFQDMDL